MSEKEQLKPGDVVAVFAKAKEANQKYIFYGEIADVDGGPKIITAVKQEPDGKLLPKMQAFPLDKWEIIAIIKVASWDKSILFEGDSDEGQGESTVKDGGGAAADGKPESEAASK